MAVDLGTANTLVYVRGRGVLVDEPSVVAINEKTGELVAVGHDAKRMIGRTPESITAIRPLQDGVIADFEATEQLLRHLIALVHRRRYFAKPRMVICVPSGITAVEQRAVKEAGYQAGARRVYIIEEPMAAAIGAGLPVHKADRQHGRRRRGRYDRGRRDLARRHRHQPERPDRGRRARPGHHELDEEGARAAARRGDGRGGQGDPRLGVPRAAGRATREIRGRDLVSGLPRTVMLTSADIRTAIEEPLHAIIDAVRVTLDQTPPDLAGDILDRGIVLTGGGALLRGLDDRLRHETGMPVHVAEDPLHVGRARRGPVRGGVRGAPAGAGHRTARDGPDGVTAMMTDRWPRTPRRPVVEDRLNRRGSLEPREPGRPRRSLVVALVLACVTLMTLDHVDDESPPLDPLRRLVGEVYGPVESGVEHAWSTRSSTVPHWLRSKHDLAADIDRLESENDQLRCELATSDYDRNRLQEYDDLTRAGGVDRLRAGARPGDRDTAPRSRSRGRSPSTPARAPGCAPDMTVVNGRGAGRPGHPGHLDHRHRAAGRRRRLHGGRPGRAQHEGRLPARPRRPRPGRPARPRAGRPDLRAGRGRDGGDLGQPGRRAVRLRGPGRTGRPRSTPASARPPSAP